MATRKGWTFKGKWFDQWRFWNRRVRMWLNGRQMIHLSDSIIGKAHGAIALQIHDGGGIKVRWRNIHVIDLSR